MKTLQVTINDKLAVVALNRGRSNALTIEMLRELIQVFRQLDEDGGVNGVIITGKERFFSAGVDLIEVYHYNEEQVKEFWTLFMAMQATLVAFEKPMVAAISGHSPAGGCIIALCCDYRIMARGDYIIGLNEIPVGIIVPESVFQLYSFWLGTSRAYHCLLEGKLFKTDEAYQVGLVDAVADASDLMKMAEDKVRAYIKLDQQTWRQSKLNFRCELIDELKADHTATLEKMLQQWWSPSARRILQSAVEKLTSAASAH